MHCGARAAQGVGVSCGTWLSVAWASTCVLFSAHRMPTNTPGFTFAASPPTPPCHPPTPHTGGRAGGRAGNPPIRPRASSPATPAGRDSNHPPRVRIIVRNCGGIARHARASRRVCALQQRGRMHGSQVGHPLGPLPVAARGGHCLLPSALDAIPHQPAWPSGCPRAPAGQDSTTRLESDPAWHLHRYAPCRVYTSYQNHASGSLT